MPASQPMKYPAPGANANDGFATAQRAFAKAFREKAFRQAAEQGLKMTRLRPGDADAWQALGAAQLEDHRPGEAAHALEHSLRLRPDHNQTLYMAGKARLGLQDWPAAERLFSRLIEQDPEHALAHMRLANLKRLHGDEQQASELINRAVELAPNNAMILSNRIQIDGMARRVETAVRDSRRLLELDGDNADYYNLAAVKHADVGLFEEAEHYFAETLKRRPDHLKAFSNRIFNAHYNPRLGAAEISDLISQWRRAFNPTERPARPAPASQDSGRPLRLGLLSAGLRNHPVGQMITSALEALPAREFELLAYSGHDGADHITDRLRAITSQWHQVINLDAPTLAQRIRDDQVDILIDLSGHTDGNRLDTLALEPAPLIVKWVGGLVNTTGLDAIDYLISDAVETPPGCDDQYYEKLIRLPDDYICYLPPPHAPEVGPLPAAENQCITFGCLNNPAKLNDDLIREWATLLHQVNGSRLLLRSAQYSDPAFRDRVWQRFEQAGVERDRILMEGPDKHAAFLDTYNRIDIALDPWPYSGGLTTCEALLMGVPVITLPGPTFAGRHAATHLVNAGLPELVVDSWDAYRARARQLAGDLDSLAGIRRQLRDALKRSPVCDAPRFAGHLTTALRGIWERHCRQQPAAALTFNDDGSAVFEDGDRLNPFTGQGPTLAAAAELGDAPNPAFEFDFTGKLITLDNGGHLLENGSADALLRLNAFELLIFDPLGQHSQRQPAEQNGFQYFANAALGDGQPATHYACLDPNQSATLKPLGDASVLAKVPVRTVSLATIEGLPSLDWLLLDDRHDSLAVLRHGGALLADALLIQARARLRPSHEGQPTITDLILAAQENGFRLYRFNNNVYHSHFPDQAGNEAQATELAVTELLFVPDDSRLEALDANRKRRLGFLLHSVYGIHDLTWSLLNSVDEQDAAAYLSELMSNRETPAKPPAAPLSLPDAPHMSASERALFDRCLAQASRYFEFGAGGSTVRACQSGLTVHGVESDRAWVDALGERLGEHCQVQVVDIGPTREWGYPVNNSGRGRFPEYSEAIHLHDQSFDMILVDGRFRVACVLNAIEHTLERAASPGDTRIFIHDFWDRPHYHAVLEFLDIEESAQTAGVFRVKPDLDRQRLRQVLEKFRFEPA